MKAGCVLLAAGAGKRFGGSKLLYEVEGEPMITRALRLYANFPFAARVCVTQAREAQIQALALERSFTVVINSDPERGVGTSVSIGTEAVLRMEPDLEGILYAVSDQPYLEPASVTVLLDTFSKNPERIVSLSYHGTRGNPVVFPRSMFPNLTQLKEDIGGGAVIHRYPDLLLLVEAGSARELKDVDTRDA
ncbi:MAG: nucleotidyltransferase family protein [Eubacteriales bacterium]|nr:nucleotidyltransferase family protein [Eubacteriales bacterium]